MSEDDNYRVEARLTGASRGVGPTTEQIQSLLERRRAHEKLTRAAPSTSFAQVLGKQGDSSQQRQQNEQSQRLEPGPSSQKLDAKLMAADASAAAPNAAVRSQAAAVVPRGLPNNAAVLPPTGPPPRAPAAFGASAAPPQGKVIIRG